MASQKSSSRGSDSEALRRDGDKIFREVSQGSYSPCVFRDKLARANQNYTEALGAAGSTDSNEKALCCRSLGSLNWLWGMKEWNIYIKEDRSKEALRAIWAVKQHIPKAVEFHILALEFGESGKKPSIWLKQEEAALTSIFDWVKKQLFKYEKDCEPILDKLCQAMENVGSTSSQRKKQSATILFCLRLEFSIECISEGTAGIRMEDAVYSRCLSKIKDCHWPLVKAEAIVSSTKDTNLIKEFEKLKEQVSEYQGIYDSVQERCKGDDLFQKALLYPGKVGVEYGWDAIDRYKLSLSLDKKKDLEREAILLSRIGKVYSSVLKLEEDAYPYHGKSIEIAQVIMSSQESEWYKYSLQKVNEHQRRKVEEDKNLIKVEGEKSAEYFLQFIYREHIPRDPGKQVMGTIGTKDKVKAALKRAMVAYHPDHNGQYDWAWKVLCEEISKILICKLRTFK